ncbi:hypothetical protein ACK3TF_006233 [Chlorella vulgaris]
MRVEDWRQAEADKKLRRFKEELKMLDMLKWQLHKITHHTPINCRALMAGGRPLLGTTTMFCTFHQGVPLQCSGITTLFKRLWPRPRARGNSMYQWLTTYFPTFKLDQTKQSQLHMEHYRHQALEQLGQAAAEPLALLAGAAPVALPALPALQPQPAELEQQLYRS